MDPAAAEDLEGLAATAGHRARRGQALGAARKRARAARLESAVHSLHDLGAASLEDDVSEQFTFKGGSKDKFVAIPLTFDGGLKTLVDKTRSRARLRRRAVASYHQAVCRALVSFLRGARLVLCSEVADDATLWTRLPPTAEQKKALAEGHAAKRRRAEARGKKRTRELPEHIQATGRNVATTCMSLEQHVIAVGGNGGHANAVKLHTPMLPLPRSNWSTIFARKRRWCIYSGANVKSVYSDRGTAGDAGARLEERMAAMPVICKLCTTDSATSMLCVSAQEERWCAADSTPGQKIRLHFGTPCMAHQACLLTRPCYQACGDLSTSVLRLGHILGSARQFSAFLRCLDQEIDSSYEHVPVFSYPDEMQTWRRYSMWIMTASQAAQDLIPEEVEQIVNHFNGKWEPGSTYKHYCRHNACPSKCRDAEDGKAKARANMRLALSRGMVLALLYRWKGMDQAGAWALRGRGLCDILLRSLLRMFSKKSLEEADAIASTTEDLSQLSHAVKSAVKASSVIRSFRSDPDNRLLVRLHLLSQPLQSFLNRIAEADKCLCSYTTACTHDPDGEDAAALMLRALQLNRAILSGREGAKVVDEFMLLLDDLSHARWEYWSESLELKLQTAPLLVRAMGDAWIRLVFRFQDCRYEILERLLEGPGATLYDAGAVRMVKEELLERRRGCPDCFDLFGNGFLALLERDPELAWATARQICAHVRVGSGAVERAHLRGQELHPARARAVAACAANVSEITYQKKHHQRGSEH